MVKRVSVSIFAAIAGLALLMGVSLYGTGTSAEAAPEDDIAQVMAELVAAWNSENAAAFIDHFTDTGLLAQFGVTRDEALATIEEEMESTGPIADFSITEIRTASGGGSATVEIEFEVGFVIYEKWSFIFQDGSWKIAESEQLARPIPPGVPVVQLDLDEYAFVYDENAVKSGNFAFKVDNVGVEPHEVVVLEITGEGSLLEILMANPEESDEPPEGIEFLQFGGFYEPGQDGTVVFNGPLDAGRYGLICFIPTPDGTPHAFVGMVSEFTVGAAAPAPSPAPGGGGTVRPPSTGDAGILGETGVSSLQVALAAAGLMVLAASVVGLRKVAVRH